MQANEKFIINERKRISMKLSHSVNFYIFSYHFTLKYYHLQLDSSDGFSLFISQFRNHFQTAVYEIQPFTVNSYTFVEFQNFKQKNSFFSLLLNFFFLLSSGLYDVVANANHRTVVWIVASPVLKFWIDVDLVLCKFPGNLEYPCIHRY